jgi:fatty acid-binding protein DegV
MTVLEAIKAKPYCTVADVCEAVPALSAFLVVERLDYLVRSGEVERYFVSLTPRYRIKENVT